MKDIDLTEVEVDQASLSPRRTIALKKNRNFKNRRMSSKTHCLGFDIGESVL